MSANGEAAERYASVGWPVFPVQANDPDCGTPDSCRCKAPLTRNGFKDAETSPGVIGKFWERYPDANVGIATGAPGPDVLDVDVSDAKPGYKSLNEAKRAGLVPSPSAMIRTPRNGVHLYYAGDDQRGGSLPKQGLDFRGQGGYVLAPPSQVHGKPYVVVSHSAEPSSIDWAAIREHFQPQQQREPFKLREGQPLTHLVKGITDLPDGHDRGANGKTFWALCRALEHGDTATADEIERAAISKGLLPRAVRATRMSAERTVGRPPGPKVPAADREAT